MTDTQAEQFTATLESTDPITPEQQARAWALAEARTTLTITRATVGGEPSVDDLLMIADWLLDGNGPGPDADQQDGGPVPVSVALNDAKAGEVVNVQVSGGYTAPAVVPLLSESVIVDADDLRAALDVAVQYLPATAFRQARGAFDRLAAAVRP